MQNRYTGDIGDYGKLGLLRTLQSAGLSIGVNWYLTPDESHNSDGRHIRYLQRGDYRGCDSELWNRLKEIVESGERNVGSLQQSGILDARYYSPFLDFSGKTKQERAAVRAAWHKTALTELSGADIVFVDPDNGLLVPSADGTRKENKYVRPEELLDYYHQGSSVVYYQHRARKPDAFYVDQQRKLLENFGLPVSSDLGLKFKTTSQRYYFFIMQPQHEASIRKAVRKMMETRWQEHFVLL